MSCAEGYNSVGGWCFPTQGGVPYPDDEYTHGDGGEGGGGLGGGNVVFTSGGTTGQVGNLNTYLQALLSGFALLQHAPYVPTQIQPAQQQYYNPNSNNNYTPPPKSNNALGGLQDYISKHTGAALLVAVGAMLFIMKPPTRR